MGCGVIGAALVLLAVCCWQVVQVGGVIRCGGGALAWSSSGPRGHRAGTDPAGRAGVQQAAGPEDGQKKKGQGRRRGVRCCSGLWSAVVLAVAIRCAGCIPVQVVGGGDLLRFRCRSAAAGTDPGATVPAGNVPASRAALAVLHPGRFGRLPEGSDSPPNGIEKQV